MAVTGLHENLSSRKQHVWVRELEEGVTLFQPLKQQLRVPWMIHSTVHYNRFGEKSNYPPSLKLPQQFAPTRPLPIVHMDGYSTSKQTTQPCSSSMYITLR